MTPRTPRSRFYVPGGPLSRDAPCYVMREADLDLHAAIARGEYCTVLASGQMGKTSLLIRMADRLREERAKAVVLDLHAIGTNLTVEQWYFGLLASAGSQLHLETELEDYWENHARLSPLQRWMGAWREVILERIPAPIVIFIDEIGATRSLPFSADEFFNAIRQFYNERSETPRLRRLIFCWVGVATPSDLIQDSRAAPFNIGHRIELNDFTEQEAQVLLPGLHRARDAAPEVLRRILYWTGGHPYLTQRLCQAVAEDRSAQSPKQVDRVCGEIFFSREACEPDHHLMFVQDRLLRGGANPVELLTIYANIWAGKLVQDDPAQPLLDQLRLAGVVRSEDGFLRVRNRIYERVFDHKFVEENLPLDEVERQRKAEGRGRRAIFSWAVPAVALFAALALVAFWQGHKARQDSQAFRNIADTGLATTSSAADEIYAASRDHPELLGIYARIVGAAGLLVETMLHVDRRSVEANDLKANSLYVAAQDAIRRGDAAAAASTQRASRALAETLKADPDLRLRAIAARLYAAAAETSSKLGDTKQAERDVQDAQRLAQDVSRRTKPDDSFTLASVPATYDLLGAAEEGMDHWDQALQFRESHAGARQKVADLHQEGPDDRRFEIVHDALQQRNRTAQIEFENYRYQAAREVLEERSLAIANTLIAWNNQPEQHRSAAQRLQAQLDLWDVKDKLAFVLAARKSTWQDATRYYTQAIQDADKLLPADSSVPNLQRRESEVAELARLQKLLGLTEQAERSYVRYVALVSERANAQPGAETFAKLGYAHQQWAGFEAHHGPKSAAPADYQSALDWLSKVSSKDGSVEREIAAVTLKLADIEGSIGSADQARQHYRAAASASARCIGFDRRLAAGKDSGGPAILMSDYENLAFSELGSGDHKSAQEALAKMLDAAKAAVSQAQAASAEKKTLPAMVASAVAYARLAWAELLNNHVEESIQASRNALAKDKPVWMDAQAWAGEQAWINGQAWMQANLAHAYLLANRLDQAKSIYLSHRGEEMYDEPFELSVLDDFAQLRKAGFDRPAMAEIAQGLGQASR